MDDSVKKGPKEAEEEQEEDHGFQTNLGSTEWLEYFNIQLEDNLESSSVQILGFNWAKQLYDYLDEHDRMTLVSGLKTPGFQVQKYRSQIFYLNMGVRQIRIESDLDGLIKRKQT